MNTIAGVVGQGTASGSRLLAGLGGARRAYIVMAPVFRVSGKGQKVMLFTFLTSVLSRT